MQELGGKQDPLETQSHLIYKAVWLRFPLDNNISHFADILHDLRERSRLLGVFLVGYPGESYIPSSPHPWLSSFGLTEASMCV